MGVVSNDVGSATFIINVCSCLSF